MTSATSEGAQGILSKITFSKSVRSNEKDELCHSFLVIFTKSLHRGGVAYGPKLKTHVGNCAEEHSVISSLCLVILIRGSLALQCRLVCLRKCSVSSVISSGVPSLLPGMSLISTPLVVSVPSVPPPPPLSRGVRGWEWGWLQLVVARLEK